MLIYAGNTARGGGAPTYNGAALTQADQQRFGTTGPECSAELWYLLNPPTGSAYTISIPNSGGLAMSASVVSAKAGSGKSSALDVVSGKGAVGTNPVTNSFTTTVNGDAVFAVVANGAQSWGPSAQTGTLIHNSDNGAWGGGSQYLMQTSAGSTTMGWTFGTSEDYGIVAAAFKEVTAWEQNLSDSVTLSESPASERGINTSLADSVTLSDNRTNQGEYQVTMADALTLNDNRNQEWVADRALSDAVTLSDSPSTEKGFALQLADSVTLSDTPTNQAGWQTTLADSVNLSDTRSQEQAIDRTLADAVTLSDLRQATVEKTLADALTLSDVRSQEQAIDQTLADAVTLSDLRQATVEKTLADTLTLSDTVDSSIGGIEVVEHTLNLADTVTLSDSPAHELAFSLYLSDSFMLSDIDAASMMYELTLADILSMSEAMQRRHVVYSASGVFFGTSELNLGDTENKPPDPVPDSLSFTPDKTVKPFDQPDIDLTLEQ
jgi:hypothetical protein